MRLIFFYISLIGFVLFLNNHKVYSAGLPKITSTKTTSTKTTPIKLKPQDKLNDVLKKLNDRGKIKLPKNVTRDRSNLKSNMRQTSDDAFFINELTNITLQVAADSGNTLQGLAIENQFCPFKNITCDFTYKFRSYNGICNNKKNPLYGSSNTPYKRILIPAYDDGYNSPRTKGIAGKVLPHPRTISIKISPVHSQPKHELNISQIYAIFGQFLIHDLSGTAATTDSSGVEFPCPCSLNSTDCLSLPWPSNDPYLPQQTCMLLTRSSASFSDFNCSVNYREQLNLLSSYIDGSALYGIDEDRAKELRTFTGGLLKTSKPVTSTNQIVTNGTYLPLSKDVCSASNENYKCFLAGEYRTSENLALVSMHTLFNREHNRIAKTLAQKNPSWNDEKLYQETRRILIAIIQHIVYNEWLPIVSNDTSLSPLKTNNYYTGYNSSINPALYNEFSTAAFRFGHSLIVDRFRRFDYNGNQVASINFTEMVFKSDAAYHVLQNGIDNIFRGTILDNCWKFGSFGNELQNKLFGKTENNIFTATDLLATNILRGRDHGLQSYTKYVKYCHNIDILSFDDLKDFMRPPIRDILQTIYANVTDIDLYVGALLETRDSDLVSSPKTFGCLIMKQFAELKNGDRFYYENGPEVNPYPFSLDQLGEIKKVTMAGLICNNYQMVSLPGKVFYNSSSSNPKFNCESLKNQIDLSKWTSS